MPLKRAKHRAGGGQKRNTKPTSHLDEQPPRRRRTYARDGAGNDEKRPGEKPAAPEHQWKPTKDKAPDDGGKKRDVKAFA